MARRLTLGSVLAVLLVSLPAAYSHHSFNAHYFEDQSVSVQGEIVEFEYKSPHAWVHFNVRNDKGEIQRYSAEWRNPNSLKQQGITKDTLKPGDFVVITGSPGRNPSERKLHLKQIERPSDGWKSGGLRGRR